MSRHPFDPTCGLDIATTTIVELADIGMIQYFGFRVVLHPSEQHYVHEAYYGHNEALLGIARSPAHVCADSIDELEEVVQSMRDALREPVLEWRMLSSDRPGLPGAT